MINIPEDTLSLLPGHVYWKGLDNRYLGCNASHAKSIGLKHASAIVNRLAHDHLPRSMGDALREADSRLMQADKGTVLEEAGIRDDGSQGVFLTKKTPLHNSTGEVVGLLSVSFDITTSKQRDIELQKTKDALEHANKLKADFISNMEHDIRSPFSAISTFCSWLRDEETDPYKKQVLADVVDAGEELLTLCNDMLDFSKLDNDEQVQLEKKFELKLLVDKLYRLERVVASASHLDFYVDYDPSVPTVVMGDYYRVYRILLNLLSNAFKFTKEGAVLLSVECIRKDRKEALIRFTIKDTGIGMPAGKQQYIFEKFTKLSRSHQGLYKGLGIGLPIVKKFMHDLGGELDLVSEEGEGTMIACTIPFCLPLTNDFLDKSFIHKLTLV